MKTQGKTWTLKYVQLHVRFKHPVHTHVQRGADLLLWVMSSGSMTAVPHTMYIYCAPPRPCLPPSLSPLLYIQTHCPSSRLECGAEPCLDYQLRPLIKGIRNVTRSLKSDWTSVWAERWETSSSSRSAPLLYANYMGRNVGPLTPCSLSVQGWPCLLTQIKSTASSKGHFHAWPDQCPVGNGL